MKWTVVLKDNTEVHEGQVRFGDIDVPQIKEVRWNTNPPVSVTVKDGEEPILLRRHITTPKYSRLIGFLIGIKGKFVLLISEDGIKGESDAN